MVGVRRRLILGLKVSVSVGLLAYVLWSASQQDGINALGARLEGLDPLYLVLAVVLHFAAVAGGVLRYRLLLRARGLTLPLGWLSRSYLIGRFVGAFTPSTMGLDLFRSVEVAQRTGKRAQSAAAILSEKLFGLLGLSILTLTLLPAGTADMLGPTAGPMALLVLACASLGLVALRRPMALASVLRLAPKRIQARASALLEAIAEGGLSAGDVGRALALSLASHLATASVFAATGLALGVDASPATLLVVGNAIVIATLLPISIGGVGVREGVAVVLLGMAAVGPTDASLVALLGYLTGQIPALVGGMLQISRSSGAPSSAAAAPAGI